ncbi:MAG: DNA cytosine methyltransferase [Thermotaleaceae bacterium]
MLLTKYEMKLYTVNFCCGVGGQDLGLEQSSHVYKGIAGKFETLLGIDVDPIACKNFERITGNKAVCIDLFTRRQYIMFHGHEPGPEWEELTPKKLRELCGRRPDVVIMSPPCKGNSRLLPKKKAQEPKYIALNELPERIYQLVLEAWFDDLPPILLMENVPGIRDKGRGDVTLKKIKSKLSAHGYVSREDLYDCGEWGGLGQRRIRYLLLSRLPSRVPSFVFEPPKLPMKSIGDILGPLPMPGDIEKGGKMHRIPNLAWKTWERLALIPAGKDWRALEKFDYKQWGGAWRIIPWNEPSNTVTAATKGVGQSTGASAVADPRLEFIQKFKNKYRVISINEPSTTITSSRLGSGAPICADTKVPDYANLCKVVDWNEPGPTITGGNGPTNGALSVADPRLNKREGRYSGTYRVIPWEEPASTVIGQTDVQAGALNVADSRIKKWSGAGNYGIMEWNKPAKTVTGSSDIHAGTSAVADPRIPNPEERGVFIIIAADGTWHRPITTYEMAMLQGFPSHTRDGKPFELVDCSDGKAREYIGNAVPVQTATAIGNALLETLMPNFLGEWHWGFSDNVIWVKPEVSNNEILYKIKG